MVNKEIKWLSVEAALPVPDGDMYDTISDELIVYVEGIKGGHVRTGVFFMIYQGTPTFVEEFTDGHGPLKWNVLHYAFVDELPKPRSRTRSSLSCAAMIQMLPEDAAQCCDPHFDARNTIKINPDTGELVTGVGLLLGTKVCVYPDDIGQIYFNSSVPPYDRKRMSIPVAGKKEIDWMVWYSQESLEHRSPEDDAISKISSP